MRKFALHINLFLLVLFVFPQINNALHYYIVEHVHHKYEFGENIYPNHKKHDCKVSTFKIPSILLFDFGYIVIKTPVFYHNKQYIWNNIFYETLFFENISNRGPPIIIS